MRCDACLDPHELLDQDLDLCLVQTVPGIDRHTRQCSLDRLNTHRQRMRQRHRLCCHAGSPEPDWLLIEHMFESQCSGGDPQGVSEAS